jgi:class 3 adenylate cyclase
MVAPKIICSRSGKALVWFIAFLIIVVPTLLTDGFVRRLETTHEAAGWEDARERARDLLIRINDHLDARETVKDELLAFSARARDLLGGRGLTVRTASELDARLNRLVGPDGFRHWFDPHGSMVPLPGVRVQGSRRAWEALLRQIATERPLSERDQRLATGLTRILFGEIMTSHYLKQARKRVILVLHDGQRHAVFLLPIRNAVRSRPVGWVFLGVSLENAPRGWEFRRAIARLSDAEARIGCYWQSRQSGLGSGDLTDNLLDGMARLLSHGQKEFIDGDRLLMAEVWQPDPDLLLAVEVRRRGGRFLSTLLRWGRVGLWCGALVPILFLLAVLRGSIPWKPDLRRKFLLASWFLVGPPILILILWSGAFLDRQRIVLRGEAEMLLERTLNDLERFCADGLIDLESELTRLRQEQSLIQVDSPEMLQGLLRRFAPMGLDFAMVFHRDGRTVRFSDFQALDLRGHIATIHVVAKALLKKQGFRDAKLGTGSTLPPELNSLLSTDLKRASGDILNRLKLLEAGQFQSYLHTVFLRDENEQVQAFLATSFRVTRLREYLLDRSRAAMPDRPGVFWRTTQMLGARREPRNKNLRAMLDRLILQPDPMFRLYPNGGGPHPLLVLGRPFNSLGVVAVTAMTLDTQAVFGRQTKATIFLIMVLASLGAMLVAGCLYQVLWIPLDAVSATIRSIDGGDCPAALPVLADDELGTLTRSVNRLGRGLQEKAAMLPFLRRELIDRAAHPSLGDVDRRPVIVWFAGLRGFARLERQSSPDAALAMMNAFLAECERVVQKHGGEIDKFIGDTAMAVFPFVATDPAPLNPALAAAAGLQQAWRPAGAAVEERPAAGVGIAMGAVLAGQIGSIRKRLDFTVIGDIVNIAARLEKLAGRSESSPILVAVPKDSVDFSPPEGWKQSQRGNIPLRGRLEPIEVAGFDRETGI